jgi:hypothetical protein
MVCFAANFVFASVLQVPASGGALTLDKGYSIIQQEESYAMFRRCQYMQSSLHEATHEVQGQPAVKFLQKRDSPCTNGSAADSNFGSGQVLLRWQGIPGHSGIANQIS